MKTLLVAASLVLASCSTPPPSLQKRALIEDTKLRIYEEIADQIIEDMQNYDHPHSY